MDDPSTPSVGERPALSLLDLNDDVLLEIYAAIDCLDETRPKRDARGRGETAPRSLVAVCSTCRKLRHIGAPQLFRRLNIDPGIEASEKEYVDMLKTLTHTPDAARHTKSLTFRLLPAFGVRDAVKALREALQCLVNLHDLRTYHNGFFLNNCDAVPGALAASSTFHQLQVHPSVKLLQLCPAAKNMISWFLGVETLRIRACGFYNSQNPNFEEDLCTILQKHCQRLLHLELDAVWSSRFLESLHKAVPQLQTLGFVRGNFSGLLESLAKFTEVRTLKVMHIRDLGVGYHRPCRGNAYRQPGGAQLLKRLDDMPENVPLDQAVSAASVMPKLEMVQFDEMGIVRPYRAHAEWIEHF